MVRIGQLSAARDQAERALRFEASHDQLTGLPNRREFLDQLSNELTHAQQCVLFFCDLDGFKNVNDRLGHDNGDELLVEVGRRLRACVRQGDVVSRFGGDEFLILVRDQAPLRYLQPFAAGSPTRSRVRSCCEAKKSASGQASG